MCGGLRGNRLIGENALHRRLCIVEVALDADRMDVLVRRRRHLETLNLRGSRRRIEDDDLRALDAREALHRGTSRVATRRGENKDALSVRRMLHEHGQHRKRHILERTRPSMKELEDVKSVLFDKRNRIVLRETVAQPIRRGASHIRRQVVKERTHYRFFAIAKRL